MVYLAVMSRIVPGLLLSMCALPAFAEGRDSNSDNGSNDIVMRRSEDGGASWEELDFTEIGRAHV